MIIALTEILPKNSACDLSEFLIAEYDMFTNMNPRRGIIIYTHTDLNASAVPTLNDNGVSVKVKMQKVRHFIILYQTIFSYKMYANQLVTEMGSLVIY